MKIVYSILVFFTLFITTVFANTEKLILEARVANVESHCEPPSNVPLLTPPYTKTQQILIPFSNNHKGSSQWFHLDGLIDGSNYEIRISYPAIVNLNLNLNFFSIVANIRI
jgi:hypothetical protein